MRVILLVIIIFLFSFCLQAQSVAEVYIDNFDSLALEVYNSYGIPASVILGIAILESGAGTSRLCTSYHNHFGVKGRVTSSKTKSGYKLGYREFSSDEDAYLHFGRMVSAKKYYPVLKGNTDYLKWLKAMKEARYSTSSTWVHSVDKIIKRFDLARFDRTAPEIATQAIDSKDTIRFQKE